MDSIYDCKTRQNATLTGQERQGDVQLKVSALCFVIFWLLDYFSSWGFRRLIHFFHVIDKHYFWAACGPCSLISRTINPMAKNNIKNNFYKAIKLLGNRLIIYANLWQYLLFTSDFVCFVFCFHKEKVTLKNVKLWQGRIGLHCIHWPDHSPESWCVQIFSLLSMDNNRDNKSCWTHGCRT